MKSAFRECGISVLEFDEEVTCIRRGLAVRVDYEDFKDLEKRLAKSVMNTKWWEPGGVFEVRDIEINVNEEIKVGELTFKGRTEEGWVDYN